MQNPQGADLFFNKIFDIDKSIYSILKVMRREFGFRNRRSYIYGVNEARSQ